MSPGSPSQWMATRSPLPAATCRSRQFSATFSLPSPNQRANGGFDQSRVSVNGVCQCRSCRDCSAQNPSRSAVAASARSAEAIALAANSALGANRRFSCIRLSIEFMDVVILARPRPCLAVAWNHLVNATILSGVADRVAGRVTSCFAPARRPGATSSPSCRQHQRFLGESPLRCPPFGVHSSHPGASSACGAQDSPQSCAAVAAPVPPNGRRPSV